MHVGNLPELALCNIFVLEINLFLFSYLKPPLHCTSFCFSFFKRHSVYWVTSIPAGGNRATLTSTYKRNLYYFINVLGKSFMTSLN